MEDMPNFEKFGKHLCIYPPLFFLLLLFFSFLLLPSAYIHNLFHSLKKIREIPTKCHKNLDKFSTKLIKHFWKTWFFNIRQIHCLDELLLKVWGLRGPKVCKSWRSRQELSNSFFEPNPYSNEYWLVKVGFDTTENEPFKVTCKFPITYHKRFYMYHM